MKVLIVEDDRKLASFLHRAFSEEGYTADSCRTGAEALAHVSKIHYDLIILDWMLPEGDGLDVCREVRTTGSNTPILMLTARVETGEKVIALDAGADDYLTKPFHLDELMARTRALTRRASAMSGSILKAGPLTIDCRQRTVLIDNRRVELTTREFALLVLLVRNAGKVVSRAEIFDQVWGTNHDPGSNVIDVHVRHLREKLGETAKRLETVRGQGYSLQLTQGSPSSSSQPPPPTDSSK